MLLIGNGCLSAEEERTQMAIWCISAAPLIMGNDLRNVSAASKAILLNKRAIAIDQDPLGRMGLRLASNASATGAGKTQVWARALAGGDVAVALFNAGAGTPAGLVEVASSEYCRNSTPPGNDPSGFGYSLDSCAAAVAVAPRCAVGVGIFTYSESYNGQCKCALDACSARGHSASYTTYKLEPGAPPVGADITVDFGAAGLPAAASDPTAPVLILDIWRGHFVPGTFVAAGSFTAKNVSLHGTAFVRLSAVPASSAWRNKTTID